MIDKAVVLSAGRGRRLNRASGPKCLAHVAGASILHHQLEALAQAGIGTVTIIVGHCADSIEEFIADWGDPRLALQSVYNPFYAVSDNLVSAWLARDILADGALLINGDTLFEPEIIRRAMNASGERIGICAGTKAKFDDDDMKLIIEQGRVAAVGKNIPVMDANAEAIGVLAVPAAVGADFVAEIDYLLRSGTAIHHYYLAAVDSLAKRGAVCSVAIDGLRWCEVDVPDDLIAAELMMAPSYIYPVEVALREAAAG